MDYETLQRLVAEFVRGFGLHDGERTPCGKPLAISEAHALTELFEREGLSQGELAGRLQLEKSTVSRLVASLERRGWIERRTDATDTRIRRLALTASGRRLAGDIQEARRARFRRLAGALGEEERRAVEDGLVQLVNALRREREVERDE